MSKGEKSGLLSRVVKFVTNPMTNWADLDQPEQEVESSVSKGKLKEQAERKKRNDFVRKREFDLLRKIRRKQLRESPETYVRPSFFQSSLTSRPDERVRTLEKIDEIEAQMSMQWWKSKDHDTTQAGALSAASPTSRLGRPSAMYAPSERVTEGMPFGGSTTRQVGTIPPMSTLFGTSTRPLMDLEPEPQGRPRATAPTIRASAKDLTPSAGEPSGGFSLSQSFAIEVGDMAHDPGLEEAAIRFANGDDAGAESALREALKDAGAHADLWMALFDFYRAVGRQPPFEQLAFEFASRFGRSAPQWFSMPDQMGHAAAVRESAQAGARQVHWICPAVLTVPKLTALRTLLARVVPPWRIDWTPVTAIEPDALQALRGVLHDWASGETAVLFKGGDRLERLLTQATPSGDRDVDQDWWHVRLEYLRLMSRVDDFEVVALDFCVTYEVSPPSWETPHTIARAFSDGPAGPVAASGGEPSSFAPAESTGFFATQIGADPTRVATAVLDGLIVGDATQAIDALEARAHGADVIEISCAKLIRMDFAAAGALLNWIALQQALGHQIQFNQVHRLIATFFHVIGISDLARVVPRAD